MAAGLFASGLVNHPGRTLYVILIVIPSMASNARGISEQERKESGVLFPKGTL